MKTPKGTIAPDKLTGEIQLARIRLARAESQLKSAKEQARLAKRRRKEAKQAARRAKKQARLAKRGLAEAKLALAEIEGKLARANRTTVKAEARKNAAARAAAKLQKKQPSRSPASPAPKSVNPQQAPPKSTQPSSGAGPAVEGAPPAAATSMPRESAVVAAGQADEARLGKAAEPEKPIEPDPMSRATQNKAGIHNHQPGE